MTDHGLGAVQKSFEIYVNLTGKSLRLDTQKTAGTTKPALFTRDPVSANSCSVLGSQPLAVRSVQRSALA